jgi:hypothetical protein
MELPKYRSDMDFVNSSFSTPGAVVLSSLTIYAPDELLRIVTSLP